MNASPLARIVPAPVRAWYATDHGRRMVRYSMVSVVAVPVGEIGYLVALQVFGWTPAWAGVFGAAMGALPSYHLNRKWAWGKTGKSHVWKEIVPFWVIALISVLFSGWLQSLASTYVDHHHVTGLGRLTILNGAYLGGFAILWVAKYVIFNTILFKATHHDGMEHSPAEAHEAGVAGAAGAPDLG